MGLIGKISGAIVAMGALLQSAPLQAQDIPVAMAGGITGAVAHIGEEMRRGVEQAVADLNAAGGVLGRKLVLSVFDDANDPKQAVSVANRIVSQKFPLVVGHLSSGASMAVAPIYADADLVMISPVSSNPLLTDDAARKGWKNIMRTMGRDDIQGAVAGEYIASKFGGQPVAFIHDKTAFGKGLADEARKAFAAKGGKEALYEAINQGDKDFANLIARMRASGVGVIYFGGYPNEGGLLLRQMRGQGYDATFVSGDGVFSKAFATIGGPAAEGALVTFSPDARKLPGSRDVVERFRAQGSSAAGYTLNSYAALQVWAQAANDAKSLDAGKIAAAIQSGRAFDTVLGSIKFDNKGDLTGSNFVMYKIVNGEFEQIN